MCLEIVTVWRICTPAARTLDRRAVSWTGSWGIFLYEWQQVCGQFRYAAVSGRKAWDVYGCGEAYEERHGRGILLCWTPDGVRCIADGI